MNIESIVNTLFDATRAPSYDKQFEKLIAFKEALHLTIKMAFYDLPETARILCVGAGTGDELIYLAHAFPLWNFTVVEPAAAMMEQCKLKAQKHGITSRCIFHEGFLKSLPASDPFDAATSILVSHFLIVTEERRAYFEAIASRLRPGGLLVTADISADVSDPSFEGLLELWLRTMKFTGDSDETQKVRRAMFYSSDVVKVSPPKEVEAIIEGAGFATPTIVFQFMPILMWSAKKNM